MTNKEPASSALSIDEWGSWLKKKDIVSSELDEDSVRALVLHLADLSLMEGDNTVGWQMSGLKAGAHSDHYEKVVAQQLDEVSRTEPGFALAYFLSNREGDLPSLSSKKGEDEPESKRKGLFAKNSPASDKSSDLSNRQIVKKQGQQLKPFLDIEKDILSRLQGTHTKKQDAQLLYKFIFSKLQKKAPPKQWEQLSRKRHK